MLQEEENVELQEQEQEPVEGEVLDEEQPVEVAEESGEATEEVAGEEKIDDKFPLISYDEDGNKVEKKLTYEELLERDKFYEEWNDAGLKENLDVIMQTIQRSPYLNDVFGLVHRGYTDAQIAEYYRNEWAKNAPETKEEDLNDFQKSVNVEVERRLGEKMKPYEDQMKALAAAQQQSAAFRRNQDIMVKVGKKMEIDFNEVVNDENLMNRYNVEIQKNLDIFKLNPQIDHITEEQWRIILRDGVKNNPKLKRVQATKTQEQKIAGIKQMSKVPNVLGATSSMKQNMETRKLHETPIIPKAEDRLKFMDDILNNSRKNN